MITSSPSNRSGTGILKLAADKTTLNILASKTGSADLVAMRTANPLAFEALERWISDRARRWSATWMHAGSQLHNACQEMASARP